MLMSVYHKEIGFQLSKIEQSLSFLSMSVIIVCLWEVDRIPESKAALKEFIRVSPSRSQTFYLHIFSSNHPKALEL